MVSVTDPPAASDPLVRSVTRAPGRARNTAAQLPARPVIRAARQVFPPSNDTDTAAPVTFAARASCRCRTRTRTRASRGHAR